jgi:hypothetical protein
MTFKIHHLVLLFSLFAILSCKNYYNNTIHWIDSIPQGAQIDSVKQSQPSFVEIDWEHPQYFDSSKSYYVKKIKNSYDVLKMSHRLVFVNDKFKMRISKK